MVPFVSRHDVSSLTSAYTHAILSRIIGALVGFAVLGGILTYKLLRSS